MDQLNKNHFESEPLSINANDKYESLFSIIYRLLLILSYGLLWLLKTTDITITYLYHHIRSKWITIDEKIKTHLYRVPQNLAICLGFEDSKQIDIDVIIQLICWCHTLSIKTLTIYHYCDSFPKIMNTDINNIQLQTISLSSSHQSLIESARKLSQSSSKISIDQISNYLRKNEYYKFDDPDLLICFSSDQQSLQAFPPWQIRLTEIVFLPTHKHLNKSQFLDILKKFSKCEQRFGK